MDYPLPPHDCIPRRPRLPVALWLLVALIGVVLGAASLGAALTTDTRDFASRHGTVLVTRAL